MSSTRPQVMRPGDVCTVCLKPLEMLPSKRLHNAFKWLKWKCFIDIQNVFSRLKTHRLQNVFISTSSHRIWSRLTSVFTSFQLNVSKTSLWCIQIIDVLETSSSGLWNIWNYNFKHSVKYWIRLEHGFKYAALQRTLWRLVRVLAGKVYIVLFKLLCYWYERRPSNCCDPLTQWYARGSLVRADTVKPFVQSNASRQRSDSTGQLSQPAEKPSNIRSVVWHTDYLGAHESVGLWTWTFLHT